jgi:hypothetical protein
MDAMLRRKADTLNGDSLADASGIHAAIMQSDAAAERMADQTEGEIVNDVKKRGEVEDVLDYAVGGAGSPGAIAMAAQVERENVIVLAKNARDPIPIASVVEAAVDEDQRRLAVLAVVPELQFEAVGVEEVGNGFHGAPFAIRSTNRLRKYTGLGLRASGVRDQEPLS